MNRRHFLKGAAQVGAGVGIGSPAFCGERASVQGPKPIGNAKGECFDARAGTAVLSLDGDWQLAIDPRNVGREQRWYAGPLNGTRPAPVPGTIQDAFPTHHGVAWYEREYRAPVHPQKDGRYLLRFAAVDYLADVWVNGIYVGGHEGRETPFTLDVTRAVKTGTSNRLTVRVLNTLEDPIDELSMKNTPHMGRTTHYTTPAWGFNWGGIWQPVDLLLAPSVRLQDVFVRPDPRTGKVRATVSVRNTRPKAVRGRLQIGVAPASTGTTISISAANNEFPPGDALIDVETRIENPQLWDVLNPHLYRLTVQLRASDGFSNDEVSLRFGFRDFRVVNGYFRLNDKRIFLRSLHTCVYAPIRQGIPPQRTPDLLRRDMLYAKAAGFNTVRWLNGAASPAQLDLCDEIGLMCYEESVASWWMPDTPKLKEQYENSVREVILRDRNHPCISMWGLLNETVDGPVFREAVSALKAVRTWDDSRIVLLGSGRFDGQPSIGSISNPGSLDWEYLWGNEAPGLAALAAKNAYSAPGYLATMGDVHFYPPTPETPDSDRKIRTLGQSGKPVFLSEYGVGSLNNVIHEARSYEQVGCPPDAEDYVFIRSMEQRFTADWKRFGMDGVYPFAEDMLGDSQRKMARHRLRGFNLIRSNPRICGFSLTSMLDAGFVGEGVWRMWRDWKPEVMDALQDGWWPLRWCLFVEPAHSYSGRPFRVEAVLANEDVLSPGEYTARFRICGPAGVAWERKASFGIPDTGTGQDGPLAVAVLNEEATVNGPAGVYKFVANLEQGGAPLGRSWELYISDPASLPRLNQTVTVWGIEEQAQAWLRALGVVCQPFTESPPSRREVILVGDVSKRPSDPKAWRELARRMATGSVVVFLSHRAFQRDKDPVGWLPLAKKGRCYEFNDWLYHKECVAKAHPFFDGLPCKGIMDWYYYGPMIQRFIFDGQDTPDEVAAAAFAPGYTVEGGNASGLLLGSYRFGEGRFWLNVFPVLSLLDVHPAADRMLLNMARYAAGFTGGPPAPLPANFETQLKLIGYLA